MIAHVEGEVKPGCPLWDEEPRLKGERIQTAIRSVIPIDETHYRSAIECPYFRLPSA